MKKIIALFVVAVIIFSMTVICAQNNEISVVVNGEKIQFDVKPQMINGRVMVPIRAIFEAIGADVTWKELSNSAECIRGAERVTVSVNSDEVSKINFRNQIYSTSIKMDTPPILIDGRILMSARYAAEAFGGKVNWNAEKQEVSITMPKEAGVKCPKYISGYQVSYVSDDEEYRVLFGFKDNDGGFIKYAGYAGIIIKDSEGIELYSKNFIGIDESDYSVWRKNNGAEYIYCSIYIPRDEVKQSNSRNGKLYLKFENFTDDVTWEADMDCEDLPTKGVEYKKSFTLSDGSSRKIVIDSFEITKMPTGSSSFATCAITGTVYGGEYCSFYAKCYDENGVLLGKSLIGEHVSRGEKFKISDSFILPDGTVKIEFSYD